MYDPYLSLHTRHHHIHVNNTTHTHVFSKVSSPIGLTGVVAKRQVIVPGGATTTDQRKAMPDPSKSMPDTSKVMPDTSKVMST